MGGFTYRRTAQSAARVKRRSLALATASEAIGPLGPGCEVFGVNKGQFSLIDLIDHGLSELGPSEVLLSTWTASGADLAFAYGMLGDGRVSKLRLILDVSFPARQPEFCEAAREAFGDDCIRLTKSHAKFCVLRAASGRALVIRSSMNLNENRRLETFEISDDLGLAEFLEGVVAELFSDYAPGEQFGKTEYGNLVDFEKLGETLGDAEAHAAASKYFGAGPLETDIRRRGWSTRSGPLE